MKPRAKIANETSGLKTMSTSRKSTRRESLWRQGPPRARQPVETTGKAEDGQTMTGLRDDAPFDGDTLHEECGVFGIFGHADAGRACPCWDCTRFSIAARKRPASSPMTMASSSPNVIAGLVGDVFGNGSLHAAGS